MTQEHDVLSPGDITIAALIEFFEDQVRKLAKAGVPGEYTSDALKVAALRAKALYSSESSRKLAASAEKPRMGARLGREATGDQPALSGFV